MWRYGCRGQEVYDVPPQCCDQTSVLFDAEGRVIDAPDGQLQTIGQGDLLLRQRLIDAARWQAELPRSSTRNPSSVLPALEYNHVRAQICPVKAIHLSPVTPRQLQSRPSE
ncbi:hypothetical protein KBY82_07880 [Cyanobium sp. AMD-g]|uniref:DUF6970 domain-containing protein n=1 Tax=Cyanobium sp. AMD-g TaxID=2823699 RepID=UPI0020CD6EB4|nr:hypothetical protein [Cyanobium sp. AMD-g]MCP9930699.1 hypothetical protein [Cyanobium sp. AMD-g]